MTSILDILMDYCYLRGYEYSRLDGSMSYTDRDENVSSSLLLNANCHHFTVSGSCFHWIFIFSCRWRSFLLIRRCSSSSWALELVVLGSTSQPPTQSSYLTVTGYEFSCATCSYVTCIEPRTWRADDIFIVAMKLSICYIILVKSWSCCSNLFPHFDLTNMRKKNLNLWPL